VGGHALGFNYGSLGIGCIGDYSVNRDPLPLAMKQSLARLIAWQGQYVNPHGSTYFVDGNYPNLCGHRDVNATTCPGDTLYAHLPGLRGDVLWNLDGRVPTPAGQITGVRFRPTTILSSVSAQSLNETIVVEVTVRNVGTGIMVTQQPAPGMLYQESESYKSRGYAEIREAWRVGVEISPPGPIGGMDHPYRWGLPDALEPGQSATIVGQVRLRERRSRQIWAGLVQELQAWTEAQAGMADIAIVAPRSTIFLPGVGS
ncbi:MAG: N-acetylmuramoyl-L-alanine amidase, partial [Chloroflexi bacterium]|nr:N-acetylmuramoyl-L-alanine amidase [Chloroflexota bacterium]